MIDTHESGNHGSGDAAVTAGQHREPSVLLLSAPWMKSTWPSLAIGCLKAFLKQHRIRTRCLHLHLEAAARLGLGLYEALADTWGAGEALFGALLDPRDRERLVLVAARLLRQANRAHAAEWATGSACEDLRALVEEWLERERPEEYPVVGGSIGAMQLCATLYVMKRIRERRHAGWRILGGSGLVGSVAREVLARCSDIDAVVNGEGERALLQIVQRARNGQRKLGDLPGVLSRETSRLANGCVASGVDMSTVPGPDLDEYYEAAAELGVPTTALTLSFEYSRGCEWEHRTDGRLQGCTFCGLYRTSADHRRKPVERILRDIESGVQRYRVLNVAFVDAYLPPGYRDTLLDGLNRLQADIGFFTELRCDLSETVVQRLAARAQRVQLGVESFSSAVLRRLGKGTGAVSSAYSVRLCQEYGIAAQYNLMTRIPGIQVTEIDELAQMLPVFFGLVPPTLTEFYLDRNSLVFANPEHHGIAPEAIDREAPPWLARALGDSRISQVVPFGAQHADAEAAWRRVEAQVTVWRERWQAARSNGIGCPLEWRDGGSWASVTDTREEVAHIYLLDGVLYDVFVACNHATTVAGIARRLRNHPEATITEALRELVARRLVLEDGRQCVSLPVRKALQGAGRGAG